MADYGTVKLTPTAEIASPLIRIPLGFFKLVKGKLIVRLTHGPRPAANRQVESLPQGHLASPSGPLYPLGAPLFFIDLRTPRLAILKRSQEQNSNSR